MTRTTFLLALAGLFALSGCAGLGAFGIPYGDRHDGGYYETDRYSDRYDHDSGYYRAVQRDVRDYADALDRYLRISNREERAVREILEYRTYQLLDQTRARDHARVYPFPRRPGRAERFWAYADRDIERVLDRRYREPYAYYNRYGAERYREYYRYRRYDERRGWVDTRRDGTRRAPRRAAEDRRDRREDARETRRREAQREEARRNDRRERAEQERRRVQERRAEQERERRREQADRDRSSRERTDRERADRDRTDRARRGDRRSVPRRADRDRRADDDKDSKKDESSDRRRSRRGGSD
ncbi:hypothetical protein RQM47_00030 [Rubrivirga sp. S365]|uniref:Uncharacterized protein n=1 Tax=Rubrivirga litoralis TaxID=3075598 RepID=A0ABU3BP61_9BACT|nr:MULTISPECIES: hypothetical protein [unclassified Rubrivirga]MDT0630996.1 hypothetical protein [Rubrivirga sp. F394]MDT7855022.1 hypothetical protein [Rubrivirga sp. S365]